MPQVDVVFFADDSGCVPVLEWLAGLPPKARDKFIVRVERLAECGSDLRRPEADLLRDGIYELRVRHMDFFRAQRAVLCHGLRKEREVADQDIERAISRRDAFVDNSEKHTFSEE